MTDRRIIRQLPKSDLLPVECLIVMCRSMHDTVMLRHIGLYHHFPALLPAPGPSGRLCQQLKSPLRRMVVAGV